MDTKASATELPKEAALYWIHCNRCFEIYARKQNRVYLLACQHMSCDNCMKPTDDKNLYICPNCNKTVRVRLLGNALPPHMKELFHPKPWHDGLPTMHIMRFQQKHMNHFVQGMERRSREYSALKQSNEEARASAKANFETFETKRHERKRLEHRVRKVIERRKQIEEENARREKTRQHVPRAPPSTTTEESGIATASTLYEPRHRYPSLPPINPSCGRGTNALSVTGPRMLSPNSASASFSNFACRELLNSFQL